MAVSFTRVFEVAPGQPVLARQYDRLARAGNDRLRSGLGDGPFRLRYLTLSACRQIRNPDASFNLWPALAEYLEAFHLVDPSVATWPLVGPGEPEGANVVAQIAAYVYGAEAPDLWPESSRLTNPEVGGVELLLGGFPPADPVGWWQLGKLQRGAYDPETFARNTPALDAAASYAALRYGYAGGHGLTYGGFAPHPQGGTVSCGDETPTTPPNWDYECFFTATVASPSTAGLHGSFAGGVLTYPGRCPDVEGNVGAVVETEFEYLVYVRSGSSWVIDVLPLEAWIEGPYTGGGYLRQKPNNMISRMQYWFAREFRGTDDQRATGWLNDSFGFNDFLTTQYLLAPAYATTVGNDVVAQYPELRLVAKQFTIFPAETPLTVPVSGDAAHQSHTGCVFAAACVQPSGLLEPTRLHFGVAGKVLFTVRLEPDTPQIVRFRTPITGALSAWLAEPASFGPAPVDESGHRPQSGLFVELAELISYRPRLRDLHLILRLGSFDDGQPDGRGIDEPNSPQILRNYLDRACATNLHGLGSMNGQLIELNTNAVVDAFRRATLFTRCITMDQCAGYAVENGKSVLWFQRYRWISGIRIDLFPGIAPLDETVQTITEGERYLVTSGLVEYAGALYPKNAVFTGVRGRTTYGGGGSARVYDGIRHTAPARGWTNEWLMTADLTPYKLSDSSLFKPDALHNWAAINNRCLFGAQNWEDRAAFNVHRRPFDGLYFLMPAEAPSGYNYVHTPARVPSVEHLKSCRVYEPDPEIESATLEGTGDRQLVKLTFTARFQNTSAEASYAAPASISRDISTWDLTALREEVANNYRTMENGIREYLASVAAGHVCQPGAGDTSDEVSLPESLVLGACLPRFWFTRLLRRPFLPTDGDPDTVKTPITHDEMAEVDHYLFAMSEGYVDGITTAAQACTVDGSWLYDFTPQTLHAAASGNRWVPPLPASLLPDNPQGHGPLPKTPVMAETFNPYAAAMNLLRIVRVPIPYEVTQTTDYHQTERPLNYDPLQACHAWKGTAPDATGTTTEPGPGHASYFAFLKRRGTPTDWYVVAGNSRLTITVNPVSDWLYAIPETWRDMALTGMGIACLVQHQTTRYSRASDPATGTDCSATLSYTFRPEFLKAATDSGPVCSVLESMTIDAASLGALTGWLFACDSGDYLCPDDGVAINDIFVTPLEQSPPYLVVPLSDA